MSAIISRILLTGATGYVGGRLLKRLERAGYPVRCLARRPEFLKDRVGSSTEVVRGDALDAASLSAAMRDVGIAYYLVHSMGSDGSFEDKDRRSAENFGRAAREAGVRRVIYLGGLGNEDDDLSAHLASRHEVGKILRASVPEVAEFRASIVIGSGSLSFEMVRALVERLPVMVTPRWVSVPSQPIGITDLLDYLVQAAEIPLSGSEIFEIGGPEQVSYGDIMRDYARQRGLRRWMIRVPVLTPRLSSLWLGLVTPLYARVGKKLIESIRHPTVVRDGRAAQRFNVKPQGVSEAIAAALRNEDQEFSETLWSDAVSSSGGSSDWGGTRVGNRIVDSKSAVVRASAEQAFAPIRKIGGARGWYCGQWLWQLRGFLDLLVGGVGLRRGRRDPEALKVGDALDFWRVEAYEPNRRLRLAAEMKLPGRAWLEFEVTESPEGSVIRQTAIFDPVGLWGLMYWYALYPVHQLIFSGMLREIVRQAASLGPIHLDGFPSG